MGLADDLASLRRPRGGVCSLCVYLASLDDVGRAEWLAVIADQKAYPTQVIERYFTARPELEVAPSSVDNHRQRKHV